MEVLSDLSTAVMVLTEQCGGATRWTRSADVQVWLVAAQQAGVGGGVAAHLGGVGMTATVIGSLTSDLRSSASPGIGGETMVKETSPVAVPLKADPSGARRCTGPGTPTRARAGRCARSGRPGTCRRRLSE